MSPTVQRAVTLLRSELRDGPMPAGVILSKAQTLGLNRDFLKVAKKQLGIVAIRDRDLRSGQTLGWHWSLPAHAPTSASPLPNRSPLFPHRWGCYSLHAQGRYYQRQEQADTFKQLRKLISQRELDPPLWIYLTSARTNAELSLSIRIREDAVQALG